MFFPARCDHRLVQTGDGYAAHIAGAIGVSTDAQAWWGSRGSRHRPPRADRRIRRRHRPGATGIRAVHAAIRRFDSSTLVDFENDCVRTALEVA